MPADTNNDIQPKSESISSETATKTEYHFYNENSQKAHRARVIFKNKPVIIEYPYNYNETRGLTKKKVSEIEFRGWSKFSDLPRLLKPTTRVSIAHQKIAPLMALLYRRYPKLSKLIITKSGGTTKFTERTASFAFEDLRSICLSINKEISTFHDRRRLAAQNGLAEVSSQFATESVSLARGGLTRFLSFYADDIALSSADIDALLSLIAHVPFGNVSVTENFIETRNQINVAYLENVIEQFEALMDVKGDNEKEWQAFFEEFGWILASVFPYQVILHEKEAYVGGKTIKNDGGRVVDFLFQSGFRDNYALLEIKTHNKKLVSASAYREPDAFAQHADCAGAVAQCLDQKNIFMSECGQKLKILDPKVALIIGRKDSLSENQATAFELLRNNQKNVDIVTFDELYEKLLGLRNILQN